MAVSPKRTYWIAFFAGLIALTLTLGIAGQSRAQPDYAYTLLNLPGSVDTIAINNVGQIVGSYDELAFVASHGFLLSGGAYSTFDAPGLSLTHATSINDSGQIVGSAHTNYHDPRAPDVGFLLSNGSFTSFSAAVPGLVYSTYPSGINNAGDIVGIYTTNDHPFPSYGFLRSGGNYTNLNVPGSDSGSTGALAINNAGQILVYSSLGYGLYRPTSGSYTDLTSLLLGVHGNDYGINGLNDSDQIVGWYYDARNVEHGFVSIDGVLTNLDVPGAKYTWADGINNAGEIVGVYETADGINHGFLASPVPEPATLLLVIVGILGLVGWAWRSRALATLGHYPLKLVRTSSCVNHRHTPGPA
jgi:probable HAF family extracellular repeat protein